jgi:hypothetical protein
MLELLRHLSLYLSEATAPLFFAVAALLAFFGAYRCALSCFIAGAFLYLTPWLTPVLTQAFAAVPSWMLTLLLVVLACKFVVVVATAALGPAVAAQAFRACAGCAWQVLQVLVLLPLFWVLRKAFAPR